MQLLVVRHAIAEDRDAFAAAGGDERLRPLTADGTRKMERGASGLRTIVPSVDLLAASPLTRATETAEILRREYEIDRVQIVPVLAPECGVGEVIEWLNSTAGDVVAVVGHEPQLSYLVSKLIGAGDRASVELKKGSACLVALSADNQSGHGQLVWSLPPRVLRDLAG